MEITELIATLKRKYEGRNIYYQKRTKKSIRVGFRKYKSVETRFRDTLRFYKYLINGDICPLYHFKKIHLKYMRQNWFIDIELSDDKWIKDEMERNKYKYTFEVIPDVGVYRNNCRIDYEIDYCPNAERW